MVVQGLCQAPVNYTAIGGRRLAFQVYHVIQHQIAALYAAQTISLSVLLNLLTEHARGMQEQSERLWLEG